MNSPRGAELAWHDIGIGMPGKGAWISQDGLYRYNLWRDFETTIPVTRRRPPLIFIMLNPSTADALKDDPTIRRCIGLAKAHGFGGIQVANLFGLRATNPRLLTAAADPIGPSNDFALEELGNLSRYWGSPVVLAWGAHNIARERAAILKALMGDCDYRAVGFTQDGSPRHPLYIRSGSALIPYDRYLA